MISVVMAAYNASMYIVEAIKSILNQTYKKFELIIVDDGSTDNTLEIINRYAEKDKRIKIIKSKHQGVSNARNTAIKKAKYPWIAVMDSDDIALPERLERQIKAAKSNPKIVAWGAAICHINSKGEKFSLSKIGPETEEKFYIDRKKGMAVQIHHQTSLLKKDIISKAGYYNSRFEPSEDIELFDRMIKYGPILAIPEPLLLYRVHPNSLSMQKFFLQKLVWRYVNTRLRRRLIKKEYLSFDEFIEEYNKQSFFIRFQKYIRTLGQFYYRKSGLFFIEENYFRSFLYFFLAVVLNPKYSLPRLWNQITFQKS